jgi:hypothetical protein
MTHCYERLGGCRGTDRREEVVLSEKRKGCQAIDRVSTAPCGVSRVAIRLYW